MNLFNTNSDTRINDNFLINDKNILKLLENVSNDEIFNNFYDPYDVQEANTKLHQSAFLEVVTETVFDYPHNSYGEKTWKPIVNLRPFVLVSVPGALNDLKNFGFQTFDKWWDESYDKINDPVKRLLAIKEIILFVCKKSKSDLKNILLEMQPVLQYNYNHYYNNYRVECIADLHKKCQENILPR